MISLIGAIRSSIGDSWWFVKLAVAVYALYFVVNQLAANIAPDGLVVLYIIVGVLFAGCAVIAMNRNIKSLSDFQIF